MKLSLRDWIGIVVLVAFLAYPMIPGLNSDLQGMIGKNIGDQLSIIFIYAILALALNVVVGYTGLLHLGIAAFFGIGVYITGVLTISQYPFHSGFIVALFASTIGAALCGMVLSVPMLRVRGDYLALVTLGIGVITVAVLKNFEEISAGSKSLGPIPPPVLPGFVVSLLATIGIGSDWTREYRLFYYMMLGFLGLTFVVLRNLENSRLGRAWIALREDELAGSCMGLNAGKLKLYALTLASAIAGMAGCLYATKMTTTTEPTKFDFSLSATILSCLILGGLGNRTGVILGVFLIWGYEIILAPILDVKLQEMAIDPTGKKAYLKFSMWNLMIFGLALILMMRFRPYGLLPKYRGRASSKAGRAA